jgi:protease-4
MPTIDINDVRRKVDLARHKGVLPGTVLEVDWSRLPADEGPASPLSVLTDFNKPLGLGATVAALHRAAADERITGLVARVQPGFSPVAVVQELRAAIAAFRAAGKRTIAYADSFPTNGSYYLAAAFEKIVLLPAGSVGLVGFASVATFLGDALPWLGIDPEFGQRYEYKNMANVFTQTDFTDAHREASEELMKGVLRTVVADIAADRGLTPDAVQGLFDNGPFEAADALAAGLVDSLGFHDEAWAEAQGPAHLQFLARYGKRTKDKARVVKQHPTIAVIAVSGVIADGKSGFKPGIPPGMGTGADTVSAAVRAAAADPKVKAIVLRIDSPGGSAVASEVMWRELVLARDAGTPIVASMGAVAASGGYYVAAPCNRIVANATTVTGSIGVVTGKFVTKRIREKAHVATRVLNLNPNATMFTDYLPFTTEQRAKIERGLDTTYELFLSRVAEGRKMTRDQVHAVAKGRVWIATDALDRGLVDVLGGFTEAVAEAKQLAGLAPDEKVRLVHFPRSGALEALKPKESSEPIAARILGLAGAGIAAALAEWQAQSSAGAVRAELQGDWRIR